VWSIRASMGLDRTLDDEVNQFWSLNDCFSLLS
jgi:2-oxo-4-hydroxy-4-carboxy--5-ureidoimidazoline (OHCU) decarboxylase